MLTKILIIAAVVIVCIAIYGLLAGSNGWWPMNSGANGYYNGGTATVTNDAIASPDIFIIEIHENRIMHMNNEVTIDELEEIMERYQHLDEVWILRDAFRAYTLVFEEVRALFRGFNIAFAEN